MIAGLAAVPAAAAQAKDSADVLSSVDSALIQLGERFDDLAAQIGPYMPHRQWMREFPEMVDTLKAIETEKAKSMSGMFVKARAVSWLLLGYLDPTDDNTFEQRLSLSVVKDLILLNDPSLYSPDRV